MPRFNVDVANNDDEHFYVDIEGVGTVCINAGDEGVAVDIFPFHVVDNPVVSTWATYQEIRDAGL